MKYLGLAITLFSIFLLLGTCFVPTVYAASELNVYSVYEDFFSATIGANNFNNNDWLEFTNGNGTFRKHNNSIYNKKFDMNSTNSNMVLDMNFSHDYTYTIASTIGFEIDDMALDETFNISWNTSGNVEVVRFEIFRNTNGMQYNAYVNADTTPISGGVPFLTHRDTNQQIWYLGFRILNAEEIQFINYINETWNETLTIDTNNGVDFVASENISQLHIYDLDTWTNISIYNIHCIFGDDWLEEAYLSDYGDLLTMGTDHYTDDHNWYDETMKGRVSFKSTSNTRNGFEFSHIPGNCGPSMGFRGEISNLHVLMQSSMTDDQYWNSLQMAVSNNGKDKVKIGPPSYVHPTGVIYGALEIYEVVWNNIDYEIDDLDSFAGPRFHVYQPIASGIQQFVMQTFYNDFSGDCSNEWRVGTYLYNGFPNSFIRDGNAITDYELAFYVGWDDLTYDDNNYTVSFQPTDRDYNFGEEVTFNINVDGSEVGWYEVIDSSFNEVYTGQYAWQGSVAESTPNIFTWKIPFNHPAGTWYIRVFDHIMHGGSYTDVNCANYSFTVNSVVAGDWNIYVTDHILYQTIQFRTIAPSGQRVYVWIGDEDDYSTYAPNPEDRYARNFSYLSAGTWQSFSYSWQPGDLHGDWYIAIFSKTNNSVMKYKQFQIKEQDDYWIKTYTELGDLEHMFEIYDDILIRSSFNFNLTPGSAAITFVVGRNKNTTFRIDTFTGITSHIIRDIREPDTYDCWIAWTNDQGVTTQTSPVLHTFYVNIDNDNPIYSPDHPSGDWDGYSIFRNIDIGWFFALVICGVFGGVIALCSNSSFGALIGFLGPFILFSLPDTGYQAFPEAGLYLMGFLMLIVLIRSIL